MNKIINLLIISSLFMVSCSVKLIKKPDIQYYNLRGRVKFINEYSFNALVDSGKVLKGKKDNSRTDKPNYEMFFDKAGAIQKKDIYQYSHKKLKSSTSYNYDYKNKIIEATKLSDYETTKVITQYDNSGNKIREEHCFLDGRVFYSLENCYDSENRIIKKGENVHDTMKRTRSEFTYSDSIQTEIITYVRRKQTHKVVSVFDKNGNLIHQTFYNERGEMNNELKYKYNSDNRLIEEFRWTESRTSYYYYEYDMYGNLLLFTGRDINTNLPSMYDEYKTVELYERNEYTYDDHGNWILRISYLKKDKPYTYTERTIIYYPD